MGFACIWCQRDGWVVLIGRLFVGGLLVLRKRLMTDRALMATRKREGNDIS
jgi:hypothetical protein